MSLKPDKLYYSISEVSKHFNVAPSLLRYWESEFSTIKPKRNAKGTRFYTTKDVDEISKIHYLVKDQGHTISGAKDKLKTSKKKIDSTATVINKLEDIKSLLVKLRDQL